MSLEFAGLGVTGLVFFIVYLVVLGRSCCAFLTSQLGVGISLSGWSSTTAREVAGGLVSCVRSGCTWRHRGGLSL